jgi:diguanylate cyclase (GGDEF)-like protein
MHDPLTGLANRHLILGRPEQMPVRSRQACDPVAILFIDLDNFKGANDPLGHEAGDRLLQAVANRFSALPRASDTVGRLGGDKFVILAEGVSLTAGPALAAERIREALGKPFHVEGYEGLPITVTASIGIATGDRSSAQELPRDADIALSGQRLRAGAATRSASGQCDARPSIASSSNQILIRRSSGISSSSSIYRFATLTASASGKSKLCFAGSIQLRASSRQTTSFRCSRTVG